MSNLILFGFKGVGKTYLGERLAHQLQLPFVDTDQLLEKQYGLSCRTLYQQKGETAFRSLEKATMASLANCKKTIISLGGGAILDPDNLGLLQRIGKLIWLDLNSAEIKKRFSNNWPPIWPSQNNFERYFQEKQRLYAALGTYRLILDNKLESELLEILTNIFKLAETYGQQ